MPELVEPSPRLYAAWLEAHREWGPGVHEDGFGLAPDDVVDTLEGFALWLDRLRRTRDARLWWIVEGDVVLGGIALRLGRDETQLATSGHVGYGIRPSARGRGLATWALSQVLATARRSGLDRVLVVCAAGNAASARVIERCGGVLDDVGDSVLGPVRRYWVSTQSPTAPG